MQYQFRLFENSILKAISKNIVKNKNKLDLEQLKGSKLYTRKG